MDVSDQVMKYITVSSGLYLRFTVYIYLFHSSEFAELCALMCATFGDSSGLVHVPAKGKSDYLNEEEFLLLFL